MTGRERKRRIDLPAQAQLVARGDLDLDCCKVGDTKLTKSHRNEAPGIPVA